MNTVELLFCVNHRNIVPPKGSLIEDELEENPEFSRPICRYGSSKNSGK